MTMRIPQRALEQHIAVLGKTGSGKTSTAKLIVEHVVAQGARVCVLDPIKSDWWGLISSADGARPGLPFSILGGPRAHVPLHAGAGAAIAELVASSALPHSIIDMADFERGHLRFFVDFARTLMRKQKGVLYLVLEEAHMFAPKERAGEEAENMAIHLAKIMATAGRSKGIRLVVCTQRTQSLHNALLGSCDTMIAHRFTAPADADPVVRWFKGNASKDVVGQVAASLAGLKTGEAWVCSGEAQLLDRMHFPRIATYDNTATPTGDEQSVEVRTAAIDQEKLRALIGEKVKEAEDNDPAALKKRVAELEQKLKTANENAIESEAVRRRVEAGRRQGVESGCQIATAAIGAKIHAIAKAGDEMLQRLREIADAPPDQPRDEAQQSPPIAGTAESPPIYPPAPSIPRDAMVGDAGGGSARRILIALAQNPDGLTARKLAILADVKRAGSTWRGALAGLRRNKHVDDNGEHFKITSAGRSALGKYEPLPTGKALRDYWRSKIGNGTRGQIFAAILDGMGRPVPAETVAAAANVELGGSTWRGHMANLRGLELVTGSAELRASEDLF